MMNDCLNDETNLYQFQALGAYFLYKGKTSLLCDMVGLGKTIQAITATEKRFENNTINFGLIICPSTLKKNWYNEIEKFTKNKKALLISGGKQHRKYLYKRSYRYDYLIINYDLLLNDIEYMNEFVFGRNYKIQLIIDEIQYIKNKSTKRTKYARMIAEKCKYRIGLSATIIENTVIDLFSSFQVIDKTVFGDDGNYFPFVRRYCKFDFFGKPIGYKNADEIRKRISPYYIRRFKEDVLDQLPDVIENNYWISLSLEQRLFYNKIKEQIVDELQDRTKAEKIKNANVLTMLNYLRQSTLSAKLVGHKHNISTKTKELLNLLESIDNNSKVIVFCFFTDMIEILHRELSRLRIKHMAMHGFRSKKCYIHKDDRIDKIKEWDADNSQRVLLTSDILREGVNILSANYLVNFDLLFNPAKMNQRNGRFDRIGNKHKVINIINFIAEDTVEERVFNYLYERKEMSTDILDSGKTEKRIQIKNITNFI
jgi:SNF2 family DNA or RNA helicase